MAKFHSTADPTAFIPPEDILETLLVEAGAAGDLPTSEIKLLSFLGLEQMSFDFMHELSFLDTPQKPPGELRAALHLGEKVVATQTGLGDKRTRFSIFHEIGHCVLPDHREKLFVDTDLTLSWWTKARLEREANQFAADLLFQGKHFTERTLSSDISLKAVIDIAPEYGASYEAAFRRYTEEHVVPCALIVYDKVAKNEDGYVEDDDYRVHYTITSRPFRKLYFSGLRMTDETCKAAEIYGSEVLWSVGRMVEKELSVQCNEKDRWHFETEIFSNGYKIFQFLRQPVKRVGKQ
jgi:Zn-dependent peptidase ImmA (M78 family)